MLSLTSRGDDEAHFGLFDAPIHAGGAGPNFERLRRGELVAEAVPGLFSYACHCLNEMHCEREREGSGISRREMGASPNSKDGWRRHTRVLTERQRLPAHGSDIGLKFVRIRAMCGGCISVGSKTRDGSRSTSCTAR